MSFHQKSAAAMLASMVLVYGVYFAWAVQRGLSGALELDAVSGPLFGAVVLLVILAAAAHILIAATGRGDDDKADERDKLIALRADAGAGAVLTTGAVVGLGLVLLDAPAYWVAHALLGALVAKEIVNGGLRLAAYRFGI